jgi:nitroreductase
MKIQDYRKTEYSIDDLFINRWSPRAMSGEKISTDELMKLFEAARWAPSSYNNQPWRFIYAIKESEYWEKIFNLMIPFNQMWAKNAAVLIVIISKQIFDHNGKNSITHSFDAGAAWQNIALEATKMNLVAHGMEGFDYEKTKTELNIPDEYKVEAMIAIGKHGKKEILSKELQEREFPSDRKKLSEIVMEGKFIS